MKLGVLFSGGKDSAYAAYLAKQQGNELACLISIFSKNKASYMFHTPNIELVKHQAKAMHTPLVTKSSEGVKEKELTDLEYVIKTAKEKYKLTGIITGALASNYQASRIKAICDKLNLTCLNPLWHKDEISYLKELINNKFKIIITGIAAEGFNESWLGRIIDKKMINELKELNKKYKIHVAFEGGEAETFVLNCPLFKHELKVSSFKDIKEGENAWRREIKLVD